MLVVHIETKVHTVFGVVDHEGNVIEQKPLRLEGINSLSSDTFERVRESIYNYWNDLKAKCPDTKPRQEKESER